MNWSPAPLDPTPQDHAPRAHAIRRRIAMRHLPIFLDLGGKAALVVGGGAVAARRAEHLIKAGARVTTFAARAQRRFSRTSRSPNFRHEARYPRPKDFESARSASSLPRRTPLEPRLGRRRRAPAHGSMSPTGRGSATSSCPRSLIGAPLWLRFRPAGRPRSWARMLKAAHGKRHSRRLWPSCRPHGRIPRCGGQGDRLSDSAAPILGDRARGTDRASGRFPATNAPPAPNLPAPSNGRGGRERRGAARRSLPRRRGARRSRSSDLPRPSADAKGRCRALRPAHRPRT